MRSVIAIVLAAGLLLTASQAAGGAARPGEGPMPQVQCDLAETPQWLRYPSGKDISRVYPHSGASWEEGRTAMLCTIGEGGDLLNCRITDETPPDRGFGEASLKLAPLFRIKPLRCKDGTSAQGATVSIPVRWQIG